MPFRINHLYPVRQLFGYTPGSYLNLSKEYLGLPYEMKVEWTLRCQYAGREDREGIVFVHRGTNLCFIQERRFTYYADKSGSIYFGGDMTGLLLQASLRPICYECEHNRHKTCQLGKLCFCG